MRYLPLLATCVFIFVACGRWQMKNDDATPPPSNSPTPSESPDPGPLHLTEREGDAVRKYKAVGVDLKLWSGQQAKIREVELNQLLQILPEIEKRAGFIRRLEISSYKMHRYENSAKLLRIDLEEGADAAIQYLNVFDKVRAYEGRLNGVMLERAGETSEILEGDLAYYDRVNLIELMRDRPFIKSICPSGSMQFIQSRGILYIRPETTAEQLKERLDGLGRWYHLSKDLGIEIEDKTEDWLANSFIAAVDSLLSKVEMIKPVIGLVKKIEVTREFSKMTFDLGTGVFKFSRDDASNSGDLWLALADYKQISAVLNIPIDIPTYMRDRAEPLRDGFKLVADNLASVRAKLEKVKGLRIGPGEESKMTPGDILMVASNQTSERFKLFVESL